MRFGEHSPFVGRRFDDALRQNHNPAWYRTEHPDQGGIVKAALRDRVTGVLDARGCMLNLCDVKLLSISPV